MTRPDVLVAVPARDEEDTVGATVGSVLESLADARRMGMAARTHLEVAAHRCADGTARRAHDAVPPHTSVRVVPDEVSTTVGEVRHAAVLRGLEVLDGPLASTWVLSTDADTVVGRSWVRLILAEAQAARAVAVVGLADLDRWRGDAGSAAAYDSVLAAGMRELVGPHQHDHVYGANLAVRADAYLECGGFGTAVHGEDQALVDRLVARGRRVARTRSVRVRTSGRLVGRADLGLAAHLNRLQSRADAPPRDAQPGARLS